MVCITHKTTSSLIRRFILFEAVADLFIKNNVQLHNENTVCLMLF